MTGEILRRKYRSVQKSGIRLVDMDSITMAGYYLQNYPNNPVEAISQDIEATSIPYTVGMPAKTLILAALKEINGESEDSYVCYGE